jgi:tetratricopeptide (TPR) repeat protein
MMTRTNEPVTQALELAAQHHRTGRLTEAHTEYRRALALDPKQPDALYGLGTLMLQTSQYGPAEELIRSAIALKGEWAEACYHLGVALQGRERFEEAISAHRRAVALNPGLYEAQYNLATCLQLSGQRDKAIAVYERAIALRPDDAYLLTNFGIALNGAGRVDESISALRRAVAIKPDFAEALGHLGAALRQKGILDEAIEMLTRACELEPAGQKGWSNLASALWEAGRIDEAIAAQRRAIALKPDDVETHCALGSLLLLSGDSAGGAHHLEWRWRRRNPPWPRRTFSQPRWDGGDLTGKIIYLHGEQSNGDTIQFIRFVPTVLQRGGKVVVECQQSLRRLFEGQWDVTKWFSPGEPLPAFDVYCPLLSLPFVLGLKPEAMASAAANLNAKPELVQRWREKIATDCGKMKIGLAWAGSCAELQDRQRSISLRQLSPLGEIRSARYFSLQEGWAKRQAREKGIGIEVTDLSDELQDFADTAAAIAALDLVITVDTAVAHLAGAMGKPVWTLLPFVPHWRWMLGSQTTPWYPTMRLFRQTTRGDWKSVIERLAEELTHG